MRQEFAGKGSSGNRFWSFWTKQLKRMPPKKKRIRSHGKEPKPEVDETEEDCNNHGTITSERVLPPAHYLLKIESFSLLAEAVEEKYESGVFTVGARKWRLVLHPNGNKKRNAYGFISLYLEIAETEYFPIPWEVNVSFKMFLLDQIRDTYLTIEERGSPLRKFYCMKKQWGFDKLVSIESFKGPASGYLVNDSCLFGVEVFVHKPTSKRECFCMIPTSHDNIITFKIENFSKLNKEGYESKIHTVGEFKWMLRVYPKGLGRLKGFAVYLGLVNPLPDQKSYAQYEWRVPNKMTSNHHEFRAAGRKWFSFCSRWSGPFSVQLADLSKGYIVNDAVTVEVEIIAMSKLKC